MNAPRYLIGGGEKLSEDIARPRGGGGDKAHPYTFGEARSQLAPAWQEAAIRLRHLTPLACPAGEAVLAVTLHPTYLAKSYYPAALIQELKLRHLGSRAVHIAPRKTSSKKRVEEPKLQPAPLLYLAGSANRLANFADSIESWNPIEDNIRNEFRQIEAVELPGPDRAKLLPAGDNDSETPLEVVLHADNAEGDYIISAFEEFVESLSLHAAVDRRRYAGGLCFLPMRAPRSAINDLLEFTFLRAVRAMPRIVPLDPLVRGLVPGFSVTLPDQDAIAPELSVAILDGGLPADHGLDRWVTEHEAPGVGAPLRPAQAHGLAVTSAFLFGPLVPGTTPDRPPTNVDHWRIIGDDTRRDDFELFSILDRIEDILSARRYDFVNISLGPDCSMEDDDVNAWTSTLDGLLAS